VVQKLTKPKDYNITAKIIGSFFLVTILLILSLTLSAEEARAHPTELIEGPTARIMAGEGSVGANMIGSRGRIFGVFRIENFIELGGQVRTHPNDDPELGVLLKTRIIREDGEIPDVAVGIQGRALYVVGSTTLVDNLSIHFGLTDTAIGGIMLGMDYVVNPGEQQITREEGQLNMPQTRLMAEYLDESLNVGARMNLTPEVTAELGILNLDSVKAGVSFNF